MADTRPWGFRDYVKSNGFHTVYLVTPLRGWPTKIGITEDPVQRFLGLQSAHFDELAFHRFWWLPGVAVASRIEAGFKVGFPPGTIHLPGWTDSEWLKQLTAEQLVTVRTRRGFAKLEWQKLRERNEALDTRVYARAAAWIAGADRWSEAQWAELERQLAPAAREDGAGVSPRPVARPAVRRRSVRSTYMG